jgi:sigma-B regulation protein RsbU (phosphoserine phosphatase)
VTLLQGDRLRTVKRTDTGISRVSESIERLRRVPAASVRALRTALAGPAVHRVAPDAVDAAVAAFAVPESAAAALARGGALLVAPLPGRMTDGAVLVLVTSHGDERVRGELAELARRGAIAVTSAQVYEERAALASTLRTAVTPRPLPRIAGADLGASFRPAESAAQLGGDFYDVAPRPDGSWSVTIGDVCGKGVEAAVLTGQVRQSLRTAALVTDDPAHALTLLNETLLTDGGDSFVTVLHGFLAAGDGGLTLRLGAGGHPEPLLLQGTEVRTVRVRGTIVGMLPTADFGVAEVALGPGDTLLMFTDGAVEANTRSGMLGADRIAQLLADCSGLTAQTIADRVMQLVLESQTGERRDDIAVLAIQASSGAAPA